MIRSHVVAVGAAQAGARLDLAASALMRRPVPWVRAVIDRGGAYVAGRRCREPETPVRAGAVVELCWADPPEPDPPPLASDDLLLRRAGLVAVNKPSGVHCQPARHSVVGALPDLVAQLLRLGALPEPAHRLDRDTSGVVVLATDRRAAAGLAQRWRDGRVEKGYLAWVGGVPPAQGVVEAHIGPDRRARGRMRVVRGGGGQAARTRFTTLASTPTAALLWLRPETGRTHQLRVHCAHAGWPVLGDPWYGGPAAQHPAARRLHLHACWLRLPWPGEIDTLELSAPVPESMEGLGRALGWEGAALKVVVEGAPRGREPPRG